MVKNLARQSPDERAAIRVEAARMLSDLNAL
jgi:hypothetical protein